MNSRQKGARGECELWAAVPGYEGLYEVSTEGRVRGAKRSGCTGKPLKGRVDHGGYHVVTLTRACVSKHVRTHRLVALAFIPNPEGKRTVNHIDGDKLNNCVDNLEWATHSENHKHAYKIGLTKVSDLQRAAASRTGKRTCELNRPRRAVYMISLEGNRLQDFISAHEAARYVNGCASAIIACCRGRSKTHKGYRWQYGDQ